MYKKVDEDNLLDVFMTELKKMEEEYRQKSGVRSQETE